jgi:hypothetical protein
MTLKPAAISGRSVEKGATMKRVVRSHRGAAFLTEHVDAWPDRFCDLSGGSGSPYLEAVVEAAREAALATPACFAGLILEAASADSSCAL